VTSVDSWTVPAPIRVPDGTVAYAVGDIHGRADLLARIHAAIAEDAARRAAARPVVVYLGDYIDRGPASRQVLDALIAAPLAGFERIHLKGNHEDVLLRFLAGSLPNGRHWLRYGGGNALASYGLASPDPEHAGPAELEALRRAFAACLPPQHLGFLRSLAALHREGGYLFVHAGIRPGVPLAAQAPGNLLWIRKRFLESDADHGAVVVHGHCVAPEPVIRANRIGIDTGAHASGRLTCVALEGGTCTLLQT
jgi:serine/threonine protein phosphatase 1